MPGLDKKIRFTKFPNVLIDKYLPELNGSETVVLLLIARNTWGYQKNGDVISYSQFTENTGLTKNTIRKALDKLIEKKLLLRCPAGNSFRYEINQCVLHDKPENDRTKTDRSENGIAKYEPADVSDFERKMDELLTPLKKLAKEKEINTTNSSDDSFDNDIHEVMEAWNSRFNMAITTSDTSLINGIRNALTHFSKDQIVTAMDNRLQSSYYRKEKPYLLNRPDSFFGYMETIQNDLYRKSKNIYTYTEKIAMITEQNYSDADFKIRNDLSDKAGNPKWEYEG